MSNETDLMMSRLDELKTGVRDQVQSVLSGPPPQSLYKKKLSPLASRPSPSATPAQVSPRVPHNVRPPPPVNQMTSSGTYFPPTNRMTNYQQPVAPFYSVPPTYVPRPGSHVPPPGTHVPYFPPPGTHVPYFPPPTTHFSPPGTYVPPPPGVVVPPPAVSGSHTLVPGTGGSRSRTQSSPIMTQHASSPPPLMRFD